MLTMHYGEQSLRTLAADRWHETISNSSHLKGSYKTKNMVSYRSYILGYGVGPIERKTSTSELAEFVRAHCASSMRLKAMALTAYERVGALLTIPQFVPSGTVLFTSLTAAISSVDSLSCVLWALLLGEVPESYHPNISQLLKKLKASGHPMYDLNRLVEAEWLKDLILARHSMVHRGCWPVISSEGELVFAARPGIFSRDFGLQVSLAPDSSNQSSITRVKLPAAMLGFLTGLEEWEKSVSASLIEHSCYESFMTNGLLITASIDEEHLLSDPFLTEQFIKTGTPEYKAWIDEQRAVQRNPSKH